MWTPSFNNKEGQSSPPEDGHLLIQTRVKVSIRYLWSLGTNISATRCKTSVYAIKTYETIINDSTRRLMNICTRKSQITTLAVE